MATKKAADVPELRAQIAAVLGELTQVAQRPVPLAVALDRLDVFVARLASSYDPPVAALFAAHDPVPSLHAAEVLFGHPQDGHAPRAFAAAVHADAVRAAWRQRLTASYEQDPALRHPMSLDERAARLDELQRQLGVLETEEEMLIVRAELRGEQVDRRGDARASIIFSDAALALEEPPPVPAA